MSQVVYLLFKNDFIRNARRKAILRFLFGERISIQRVVQINAVLALVYFGLTSVLPLFTMSHSSLALLNVESANLFYHSILNGVIPAFLFFGLFVGAILIFNMNIDENEQLLSLPVVIDDLVQYRLADVVIANLKSHLLFFFPLFICLYLALGWSVGWVVLTAVLSIAMALSSYLGGILLMLLIAKRFPGLNLIKVLINSFIVMVVLFAGFIKLFKSGYVVDGHTSVWAWLEGILSSSSLSVGIETMVVNRLGLLFYIMVLSLCGILVFCLWKVSSRALYVVYYKIHVSADTTVLTAKPIKSGVSLEMLDSYLRFLPSFPRMIIVKDILLVVRKSNLLIAIVVFVGGLVVLTNMQYSAVDNPLLFALYFTSMFVISRLFLGAVGAERDNILNIKLLAPSIAKYLAARIQITIMTASVALIPLWMLLIASSGDFAILFEWYRPVLLILNVVLNSVFVTLFSACFAEFKPSVTEESFTGIYPMAMLLYWGIGFIVPLFFYRLDVVMNSGVLDVISIVILSFAGLLIIISTVLCYYFGIRRIATYSP